MFPLKHFGSRTSILFCVLHAVSTLKNPPIPHLNYVFVCAITLFGLYHCCQLPGLLLLTKKILDSFLFHCRDIRALRCIRLSFLEIKSSDLDASDSLWPHHGGMHSTSLRLIQPSQQLGWRRFRAFEPLTLPEEAGSI